MDTQRIGSCLTSRSMSTKDICILMVHNDLMYHNIMLEVLENSNHHEVMRCQRTADALNRIQERKEQLSIVITDIHRSHSNGFEILNHIEKEFKLPVISMNPHQNAGAVTVRLDREAKLYIMKSLSFSEFEAHWDHAYTKQRGKTNFQNVSVLQERETRTGSQIESPIHVVIQEDQKDKKRKIKEIYEQSEEDNYDIPNEKKSRIMWSEAMHHKFVQVVEFLGLHRALPEKILELMNVPSLTRENVASHLQKYQICLKRAKEERKSTRSVFSINSTPLRFCQSNYSDSPSPVTKHIPYHTQESTLMSYQPRLGPFNFPDNSAEISRNTSNHGIQQFSYSSSSLFSNTQTSSWPINTNTSVPNIFSNHPETSTTTSNSSPQNLVTTNNNHVNLIFPNTQNSHLTNTTEIYSSPFTNEIPQPDSSNNIEYVGLRVTTNGELVDCDQTSAQNNTSSTDIADLLNQSNRNESLVQFPSTQMDHNSEQEYPISTFEWDVEGYFI